MLDQYLTATRRLLQNPSAPTSLYSSTDLTAYINTARNQLAGEGECVRVMGTLALTAGVQVYPFSDIDLGAAAATGVAGTLNVRTMWRQIGSGQTWMRPRPFEWFSLYVLNNPNPQQGQPSIWSQFGQGVLGTIYVSHVPDDAYTATLDLVCYPDALESDSDPEPIPSLWTDAVPFFAAYYALLSSQNGARQADAERMMQRYGEFVARARRSANPSALPYLYPQSGNPTQANQLGLQPAARTGGQ